MGHFFKSTVKGLLYTMGCFSSLIPCFLCNRKIYWPRSETVLKYFPELLLMGCWVFGTYVFGAYLNWTLNGRSLLPMAPIIAIICAWVMIHSDTTKWVRRGCVFVAIFMSMIPLYADIRLAESARDAAHQICTLHQHESGKLYFQGHWGFQFYMEAAGAEAIDLKRTKLKKGDWIICPGINSNVQKLPEDQFQLVQIVSIPVFSWCSTMNPYIGAGFYSDRWGYLPFKIAKIPDEKYFIYKYVGNHISNELK